MTTIATFHCDDAMTITGAKGLDPISVLFIDHTPCVGTVIITCFGCAWTAYFSGMSARTMREFFVDCDVAYLVNKLGITPLLRQRRADMAYLTRIVTAIKDSLGAVPA